MIQRHYPVYLSSHAIDFRKGQDGLCLYIKEELGHDPQRGFYIFYNRSRDQLKVLFWHGNGFVVMNKRLEVGKFHVKIAASSKTIELDRDQLEWLFKGLDWKLMSSMQSMLFRDY
jgi:transposase